MFSVPLYYLWNDENRAFHEMLQGSLKDPRIQLNPIEISGALVESRRAECILEVLKTSGEAVVLFSNVATVFKSSPFEALDRFNDDMMFLKHGDRVSTGFMILRANPETIAFWESMRVLPFDEALKAFGGKWSTLDSQQFTSYHTWNMEKPYVLMELVGSGMSPEFDMAEKIFQAAQGCDFQPFMEFVKSEVLPYIYEFQDLLMKAQES